MNGQNNGAIEKGEQWMKQSHDVGHDFTHAHNVETHAQKIFLEMLAKQPTQKMKVVTPELVSIAALWHDCFKATQKYPTIVGGFLEGFFSVKIIKKEISNDLTPAELKLVCDAVRLHNYPWVYIFSWITPVAKLFRLNTLGQILIEADTLESLSEERYKKQMRMNRTAFNKIFFGFVHNFKILTMRIYLRSQYAKNFARKI